MIAFIAGILTLCMLTFYFFYPAILFMDMALQEHSLKHRIDEWRELVAQQIVVEYQMLCQINEIRKKFGMEPLPQHAIVEQFKGFGGWTGLRLKVEQSARLAIRKLAWF